MREQERRQQIMRAAEQLFASRRFHEITTEEIAAKAGVGKGTIYRYFKDKDDLFHQTAMHGFEELCLLLESEDQAAAELPVRLLQACRRIDSFFQSRRRLFGLMQAEENRLSLKRGHMRQHWRQRRERLSGILAAILADAAAGGEIRGDIEPRQQAAFLLGMLKSLAHNDAGSNALADPAAVAVDLFLNGARQGAATA
jgi:AcrR family transcriptional regulator